MRLGLDPGLDVAKKNVVNAAGPSAAGNLWREEGIQQAISTVVDACNNRSANALVDREDPYGHDEAERPVHTSPSDKVRAAAGLDSLGKAWLRDGRTGERFDASIAVGVLYICPSLAADAVLEARSAGAVWRSASMPVQAHGKARGQCVDDLTLYALASYGARHCLHEIQTTKSSFLWDAAVDVTEEIMRSGNISSLPAITAFDDAALLIRAHALAIDYRSSGVPRFGMDY